MTLRAALFLFLASLLAGCVTDGGIKNPLGTAQGREQARDAYIQLGLGYLMQGATEKARAPLKSALELDPSSAQAHATLAVVFQREMESKLAEEHYRKALSLSSNEARILNNYGGFLFEQKRYQEAFDIYLKASEDTLYAERSRVFENLGLTALQLDRRDEAKGFFARALRLNSHRSLALLQMAQLSYEDQQYVPARGFYERFSKQSAQTPPSLLLGIHLAKVFEDRNQVASLALQLKRLYPGTPEYQQYLSEQ